MRRLAKNSILAMMIVSAIFFVDYSSVSAATICYEKFCTIENFCLVETNKVPHIYLDFWSKFRDTVMPNKPQNNNPPKEMHKPRRAEKPKPVHPPKRTNSDTAQH